MKLLLSFKDEATYQAAKTFFDNESEFYPDEAQDEYRTFVFEESNDIDVLEAEISKELEDEDFTDYYFESE